MPVNKGTADALATQRPPARAIASDVAVTMAARSTGPMNVPPTTDIIRPNRCQVAS